MSSRSSSTSSDSSCGFDTEVTIPRFETSNDHSDSSEQSDTEETKPESAFNENVNNGTRPTDEQPEYQAISIEELSEYENVETEPVDQVDSAVVLRGKLEESGDASKRSSFKRQARLSRMLQDADTSSSDDDDLYMVGSFQQRSPKTLAKRRSLQTDRDPPVNYDSHLRPAQLNKEVENNQEQKQRESEPTNVISSIDPNVLSEVKAHLRRVERSKSRDIKAPEPSPAKQWELRKKQENDKLLLNKTQASKIKAGWRVRQCLGNLPDGETVNTLYLTLVKRDMLREVEALFSLARVSRFAQGFDKNYKDEDDKSALTIAIDNKNEAMLGKLIEHGVNLGISLFHVIEADFMQGLKMLLMYNACTGLKITEENHYFKIGMTPMLLAAHNNNYRMLSLLHEYGHRLTELKEWYDGIHIAWESANERRMICEARAQPAYITLMSEVNQMNPMKYCLRQIKKMKEYADKEHEFSSYYKQNIVKLEDYMCSLLDYICSSGELADLFQFENCTPSENDDKLKVLIESTKTDRATLTNRFKLLERASKAGLVRFVTHQQSQLALSYLRYRSLPYLRHSFLTTFVGFLFPILSIFYVLMPNTFIGSIITLPTISFSCHVMSDVTFALLLLLNISFKDETADCIGARPTSLELILVLWILGKWVQEVQECSNRGIKDYLRDYWNYTDLIMLTLFSAGILIRMFDMIYNMNNTSPDRCRRYKWEFYEPKLIAEGLQAWAYVFVFIRMLGIMRVNRYLGPLQISLAKMLMDIWRFLALFVLMLGAFGFGLSDLYWYYGTKPGLRMICNKNLTDINETGTCATEMPFTNIGVSIVNLFWALFGLFDLDTMHLSGKHYYTEVVGKTLVATYHAVAIIVMLNMLIAMMSNSYNDTSINEEISWKFHRTSMWIRYIRREVVRPPPMNLFPNPWRLKENFHRLKNFFQRANCCREENLTDVNTRKNKRLRRTSTMNSRLDMNENDGGKFASRLNSATTESDKARTGCFANKKSKKSEKDIESGTEKRPHSDTPTCTFSGPTSPRRKGNNAAFTPAVLTSVKNAMRRNFVASRNKRIVRNLVQRYKLKHLVRRETNKTLQIF